MLGLKKREESLLDFSWAFHTHPKLLLSNSAQKGGGRLNPSSSPPPSKKSVGLILRSGIIFGGLLAAAIRSRREGGADNKQREKAEEERANRELTARRDRKKYSVCQRDATRPALDFRKFFSPPNCLQKFKNIYMKG